jgi:hypothetical protein
MGWIAIRDAIGFSLAIRQWRFHGARYNFASGGVMAFAIFPPSRVGTLFP